MTPASRIASISSDVATGRRMNGRDGFIEALWSSVRRRAGGASAAALAAPALAVAPLACARRVLARRRRLLRRPCGGVDQFHARAVAELVGAVDHDQVARRKAFAHLGRLARDCANL